MSGVQFKQVTKRYDGDVVAVESLNLDIEDREFLVLLGPSGCGKSTALRMIAGLEEISDGDLLIGDRRVNDVPASERDIAMVFQSYALYPHMTVRKNIESPLVARKVTDDKGSRKLSKGERDDRVQEAASILGLDTYLDRKPGALSGGQRQRVALARAIVRRPEVFLMDEPLSNLDAKLRTQTRAELVELHRRLGITFVYVTHDQVEAMTMATRVAVMSMGRLQQVGTPQAVYERPANLFVAGFIGSPPMNTIPLRFTSSDGRGAVVLGEGQGWWVDQPGAAVEGDVIAGVRPEHLLRRDDGQGVRARVDVVEQLGHERHLLCTVADARVVVREPQDGTPPQAGEEIHLVADPEHVHLFDPTTTERVN